VGSTRRPKLDAVREVCALIGPRLNPGLPIEVLGFEVPSGVRHTPLTREDTMSGARQRAEALAVLARQRNEHWKYFIGLEGGLDIVMEGARRLVFLQNWAYVADVHGFSAFGHSGGILLPESLAASVVDQGVELSAAIDAFAGSAGIRDGQGAWGVLTGGLITRQEAFRVALINAFSPFLTRAAHTPPRDQ
jgi:non-canonical (house-cleaning) NTP pyrophosphatase